MNISVEQFIKELKSGKTVEELNKKEVAGIYLERKIKELIRGGHTFESAKEHLETDYSNGFTVCKKCGSYYHLGSGFTKHLSDGCLCCEGDEKHRVYFHTGNNERDYKSPPRYMSIMFDDGMHYCKDKLEVEKYKEEVKGI